MFNEARLLDKVAYGSEFGHSYKTRIEELRSGVERRNAEWDLPLGRYSLIYQNIGTQHHGLIVAAHHACKGMLIGFRLKDFSDYKATNEPIGFGTGAQQTYQLTKTYTFGTLSTTKKIFKPVQGLVSVFADGTPITPDSIDYTTGIVTLTAPSGQEITWTGEYDVPVRFDNDEIDFSIDNRSGGELILNSDVQLVELRL